MALKFPNKEYLTFASVNRLFALSLFCITSSFLQAQPWKAYYDSTQAFWEKDWNKTIDLLKHAEESALEDLGTHDEKYLTILNDLGVAYWRLKDYQNAERFFSETLRLKTELYDSPQHTGLSGLLSQLAELYSEQGDINKSKIFYKKVLFDRPSAIPSNLFFSAAQNLVNIYESVHETDSALYTWKQVETVSQDRFRHDTNLQSQWMLIYARLNRKLKNYEDAKLTLQRIKTSLRTNKALLHSDTYVKTLHELGLTYFEAESTGAAERELGEAYRLAKLKYAEYPLLTTNILKDLAHIHEANRAYAKALWCHQELLKLCEKASIAKEASCIELKINIGTTLLQQGKLFPAINIFEEILGTHKKTITESDPLFITTLNYLADAYCRNKQHHKAYIYLRWAAQLIEQNNMQDNLAASVFTNLAIIYSNKDDLSGSAEYYEKAYAIKETIYGSHSIVLKDLARDLAITYWALNDSEKAIPYFKQATQLWEKECQYIFPGLNETEQTSFYNEFKDDVEKFSSIVNTWSEQHPDLIIHVFNNITRLKNLQLFTKNQRDYVVLQQKDSLLAHQYEQVKEKYQQLFALYQLPMEELDKHNVTQEQLEEEIDEFENVISQKTNGRFLKIPLPDDQNWNTVYEHLNNNEAIVHIIRFRKFERVNNKTVSEAAHFEFFDSIRYAAIVTTKDYLFPHLVLLKEGHAMEGRLFNYYKNALAYNVSDQHSYETYWKPFNHLLQEKDKIYFIPEGVYHSINVNTLWNPETNQYLIEQYTVYRLFHAGNIAQDNAQATRLKEAVLLGTSDYYLEARHELSADITLTSKKVEANRQYEIDKIEKLLNNNGWQTHVYLKNAASERNLRTLQIQGIVHLSVPIFISKDEHKPVENKNEPLIRNGLVLSEASKSIRTNDYLMSNNGWLTAYEILSFNLHGAGLIAIPFNNTAVEKIMPDDEKHIVPHCFMQAGVKSVLTSFWKTSDQQILFRFYQYLMLGHETTKALRLAQLDGLKTNDDPSFWGNLVITGVN